VLDVDDDLSDLGEIVHRFEHLGDVLADVVDENVVEGLHEGVKRSVLKERKMERREETDLPKKLVDVFVMIRDSFDELVELIHELADVDAAERIGLRKRKSEREAVAEVVEGKSVSFSSRS